MPYTKEQCALFAAKAARGDKVPADWKEHCRGKNAKIRRKVKRRK